MIVDETRLMALVDGELPADEAAAVEAAAAADPALAQRLAAHRALRAAASGVFADVIAEPVPARLLAAVRGGSANVVDMATARESARTAALAAAQAAPRAQRARSATPVLVPGSAPRWAALAATLVIGVVAGRLLLPAPDAPGVLLAASPGLVQALEGGAGGVVQAGLTYKDKAGAYCRTFRGTAVAGVACREADGWVVKVAAAAAFGSATDYRMATADLPPAVLATVDATIVGAPLDAAGVEQAKREAWRAGN